MSKTWTNDQQDAISERNRTLLVSAAAGSGKTATLTQRVISSILDDHIDITRILIVTYTRAAAQKLRNDIEAALQSAIDDKGCTDFLNRQLLLLPAAHIKTIDSFCIDEVRRGAPYLGISSNFRISDSVESEITQKRVMERLIRDCLASECKSIVPDDEAFNQLEDFIDAIVGPRNENRLCDILFRIYQELSYLADGVESLKKFVSLYSSVSPNTTVWNLPYGPSLKKELFDFFSYYYNALLDVYNKSFELSDVFGSAIEKELAKMSNILTAVQNESDYDTLASSILHYEAINYQKTRASTDDDKELRKIYTKYRDVLKKLKEKTVFQNTEYHHYSISRMGDFLKFSYRFFSEYEKRLLEELKRKHAYYFHDIERLMYKLLYDENGEKLSYASQLSMLYDHIYIDEYQDVNMLQHRIFEGISNGHNLFMVGDVKQSIYCFRHAEPSIFTQLKTTFKPYHSGMADQDPATIFLKKNFRSSQPIVDFCNLIFNKLFSQCKESIGYDPDTDSLIHGHESPESNTKVTVVRFTKKDKDKKGQKSSEEDDEEESLDCIFQEVSYITSEIVRLVTMNKSEEKENKLEQGEEKKDSEEVKEKDVNDIAPKDIAILLRNYAMAPYYVAALNEKNVPAFSISRDDLFFMPEVSAILCYLHVIDNPHKEVYFGGLMASMFFHYTFDEIKSWKTQCGGNINLFDAYCQLYQSSDDERAKRFFALWDKYKLLSMDSYISDMILEIYDDFVLLNTINYLEDAESKRKNVLLLYQKAMQFEKQEFLGLYDFLAYIDELIKKQESNSSNESKVCPNLNEVRISTIHASKGLDYKVVFLASCGKNYHYVSTEEGATYHKDFGIIPKFYDDAKLARLKNPLADMLIFKKQQEEREEEMRVLYVALTRAIDRLYVVGTLSESKLIELEALKEHINPYILMHQTNFMSLMELLLPPSDPCFTRLYDPTFDNTLKYNPNLSSDSSTKNYEEQKEDYKKRFSYRYGFLGIPYSPQKLGVTSLQDTFLDEYNKTTYIDTSTITEFHENDLVVDKSKDAAYCGTLTHKFLEFCDFYKLNRDGLDAELARLKDIALFNDEEIIILREQKNLEGFMQSELLQNILHATMYLREHEISGFMKSRLLTQNEEFQRLLTDDAIFVQGVIDLIYQDQNGDYFVVDYKTDFVPNEIKEDSDLQQFFQAKHESQLSYYASAVEDIFKKAPKGLYVYSTKKAKLIPINRNKKCQFFSDARRKNSLKHLVP